MLLIEDGLPKTTKSDGKNHGFGVRSIRFICRKYGGDCSASVQGDKFQIKIVLPIKPTR